MFEYQKHSKLVASVLRGLGKIQAATKMLKIQSETGGKKRKLVISTNWLPTFNFHEGSSVTEIAIGTGQGLIVRPASIGDSKLKKVYGRNYKNRSRETLIQLKSQKMINNALGDATHVHIIFQMDEVTIKPVSSVEDLVVPDGVSLKLKPNDDGLYEGIIQTIEIIKQKRFAKITVDTAPSFQEKDEYMLFCMQLRRLGYTLSADEQGQMVAVAHEKFKDLPITAQHEITGKENVRPVRFNHEQPLSTFAACTGGVDVYAMEKDSFVTDTILSYRPTEARDIKKTKCPVTGSITEKLNDKTEFCSLSAAINSQHARLVINEDIYTFDTARIKDLLGKNNFFHISLQCDDFSNMKNKADRQRAIESLESTRDMIFPALELIKTMQFPTLLIENVRNFVGSTECRLFEARLKALGYRVYTQVLDAKDFNGYTSRKRCFVFATNLPVAFSFPQPQTRTANVWWDVLSHQLDKLRDVTHTSSVQKGIQCGRIRTVTVGDDCSPIVVKSQSRQVKDSLYVLIDGKYYLPNNDILRQLMGIDDGFIALGNAEMTSEVIGQSVDVPMHQQICQQIKMHIERFVKSTLKRWEPALLPAQLMPVYRRGTALQSC